MATYEKTVDAQRLSSKADLILVVRNDLENCTPSVIEANITAAIRTAKVSVQAPGGVPVKIPGKPAKNGAITPSAAGLNAKALLLPQ